MGPAANVLLPWLQLPLTQRSHTTLRDCILGQETHHWPPSPSVQDGAPSLSRRLMDNDDDVSPSASAPPPNLPAAAPSQPSAAIVAQPALGPIQEILPAPRLQDDDYFDDKYDDGDVWCPKKNK